MTGLPLVWGATPWEAAASYPADKLVPSPSLVMTRAVSVAAPVAVTWRWVCQLALAPYSYDWIDNLGRRSPRTLVPGADALEIGQRMAIVFRLTSVDPPHQWTGRVTSERLFGPVAVTYAVTPASSSSPSSAASRLVCRIVCGTPTPASRVRGLGLAWGDLVMMRRQLLNLKALAERD